MKINKYEEIKNKHSKRVNEFPLGFAFSNEQFKDMMNKWGLKENDTDKIVSTGGGVFIRKTDIEEYNKMWNEIRKEHDDLIKQDKTGTGYIKDMFVYELNNHEYSITYELDDTLDDLELSYDDIKKNKNLENGLNLAIEEIREKKNLLIIILTKTKTKIIERIFSANEFKKNSIYRYRNYFVIWGNILFYFNSLINNFILL